MTQRCIAFLIICCLLAPGANAADAAPATPSKSPSTARIYKSPEERYLASQACLKKGDIPCAQVALAGINPSSAYAKILEAQIAAERQDFGVIQSVLRGKP